jgi:hypothetical protein
MSNLKTVGVIGAISGIGLIGYYLLSKQKPTISETQIDELKGEGYVLKFDKPEHRKLWSIVAQYGYDNLGKNQSYLNLKNQILTQNPLVISNEQFNSLERFIIDMNNKGVFEKIVGVELAKLNNANYWFEKRTKGLGDEIFGADKSGVSFNKVASCEYRAGENNPCTYDYIPFKGNNYWGYALKEGKPYFWSTPYPSGKDIRIASDDCVELDLALKRIIDRIAEQTRTAPNEDNRQVLNWYKDILEDYFRFNSCRDKITKQRFLDYGKTTTLGAITSEKSVLGASQKNQNIYLGIGAVVLVLSAVILTNNKG